MQGRRTENQVNCIVLEFLGIFAEQLTIGNAEVCLLIPLNCDFLHDGDECAT